MFARDDLAQAWVQGAAEPDGIGTDAGQPDGPLGVRAKTSSTGTIPRTTSAGGSIQAGRRYSASGSGSCGGWDEDTSRC